MFSSVAGTVKGRIRAAAIAPALTGGQALQTILKPNLYHFCVPTTGTGTNNTIPDGALRVAPWFVPRPIVISELGLEIITAGNARSVFRIGIYADDGTGYPGALISDAGTVPADAVGQPKITGLSISLPAGLFHVGAAQQGGVATIPNVRTPGAAMLPLGVTSVGSNTSGGAYGATGVNGALHALFPTAISVVGALPRIFAKLV
ncbi:hypothetical protein [Gordonia sp. AC31]|uniref:hypothetical protein n=1 Tax=Gordonia sp. AC31 TaxID=2962571 RepID=UPI002882C6D3|nr:hypothetical protein [Gordonia sp. AC31]MDT0223436.1 hypothetical protein [Gordonia sp. AC31]